MTNQQYVLGTTGVGVTRLEIQGEILDRQTEPFLQKWLKPDMKVLEVGCGAGNVTLLLAKLLNHTGHLTAIDLTEEYAVLTRKKITQHNFNNVTVQQCALEEADKLKMKFDLICGRAVLHHVKKPLQAIKKLKRLLKPQGIIAFQEPVLSDFYCYPKNKSYKKLVELYVKLGKKSKLDFGIGDKLGQLYNKAKLSTLDYGFTQATLLTEKERSVIPLLAEECHDAFIKEGLIEAAALKQVTDDLHELVKTDISMIYPKVAQIVGKINHG